MGSARGDRARSAVRVVETSLDFFRNQRGACQNQAMPTSPAPPLRAILMPTYSKYERYVDQCAVAVDTFWPGHPELWVLSDRGDFRHARSVIVRSPDWVGVVAGSIERLVANGALTRSDRVLLLIEDHVPIEALRWAEVDRIGEIAVRRDLKFVSLNGDFGTGRAALVERTGTLGVYEMPSGYLYFSSLHPAIWEIGHLIDMLAHARAAGHVDPWRFEKLRLEGVPHYTTDEVWSSHFGGFLKGGWVDIHAVRAMRHPALRRLRIRLFLDWAAQQPAYVRMRLRRRFGPHSTPGS